MKKFVAFILMAGIGMESIYAQDWMKGFPPEKDKIISASDGSFFEFPAIRYSVNHMREFFPSRAVPAAEGNYYVFKENIDNRIDEITFVPWNSEHPMTWEESLEKNYTDGIIILHKGKIVYEKETNQKSTNHCKQEIFRVDEEHLKIVFLLVHKCLIQKICVIKQMNLLV